MAKKKTTKKRTSVKKASVKKKAAKKKAAKKKSSKKKATKKKPVGKKAAKKTSSRKKAGTKKSTKKKTAAKKPAKKKAVRKTAGAKKSAKKAPGKTAAKPAKRKAAAAKRSRGGKVARAVMADDGLIFGIEPYQPEYDEDYIPAPADVDPVEWFLFHEHSGVCEHFNSAFVLLARSIGLPVRLVYGYLIDANAEVQTVMPEQAHVYAEAQFRNIGWISFDATPEGIEERLVSISRIPTETNITDNDDVGIKGGHFNVYGTVMALNGSPVDEVFVQVFLKVSKNETGILCGIAWTMPEKPGGAEL